MGRRRVHDADCRTRKRRDWLVAPLSDEVERKLTSSSSSRPWPCCPSSCCPWPSNPSSRSSPSSSCRCPWQQAPGPSQHRYQLGSRPSCCMLPERELRRREQCASLKNLLERGQRGQTPVRARS